MELKKTDIYIILNQVSITPIRHHIGRGASEIIRFAQKKDAENYLEKNYQEHHVVLRIKFEDEYWQHVANSHTFDNV